MNSYLKLCPKCNKHTKIQLFNNFCFINCYCGYSISKNVKEFLNNNTNSQKNKIPDIFADIVNNITEANEHLDNYFTSLKEKQISQLRHKIDIIQTSYEESYTKNKNILTFLKILIDNYDDSNELKNTILNNSNIQIYTCDNTKNIKDIIRYYKEYSILEISNSMLDDLKCEKTINDHTLIVNSLIRLRDNRIASCSDDKTIRIYNPSNDFCCEKVITRNSYDIKSFCQLENGTFASASIDGSIIFEDYKINKAHTDWINKIISLPKNRIASCSTDKTIKIWKSDYPYSNIAVLFGHKEKVISLLYIKERDVMISGASDGTLRLWNMSTYQCESVIKGIQCCYMNSIYQYDRDTILVGGEKCIFIVSVLKCKIEKKIEDKEIGNVFSFVSLRYDKTVLFGGDSNKIGILYINTGNFIMVKTKEKIGTIDLLYIDNETFVSSENKIKIWKY